MVILRFLQSFFFEKGKEGDDDDPENRDNDPMGDVQDFGQADFAEIFPRQYRRAEEGVQFGKYRRPDDHADDGENGVPASFSECADGCAGTKPHDRPAESEQQAAEKHRADIHGFVAERDNAVVAEQVNADHADEDGREHEFQDGHIGEAHRADLFVKPQDTAFLQQKSEYHAGD